MDDRAEQMQKARYTLDKWRTLLFNWICWLDSEIADIANGKAPSKTFSLLLQHISLLSPWVRGLFDIFPVKIPDNMPVTHLPPAEDRTGLGWYQQVSHKKMSHITTSSEND